MKGCFWKSAPQWQIYRREVILEFYYPFKFCYDGMVLLCMNMLCQDFCYCYFITHIKWDVIISSSLRLLLKVWIWYRSQNRIYHHHGEQLGFYKKINIKTQSRMFLQSLLQEMKNSNFFEKLLVSKNCLFPSERPGEIFFLTMRPVNFFRNNKWIKKY